MPCIEDWISHPLNVIDGICNENGPKAIDKVREFFTERVKEAGDRIPSLNDVPAEKLRHNSLVKYRCMVQDMYSPDYYLSEYECISKSDGKSIMRPGMFRDVGECPLGYDVDFDSEKNEIGERHGYYCVPIPGETEWAKSHFAAMSAYVQQNTDFHCSTSSKRALDDHDMDDYDGQEVHIDEAMETAEAVSKPKKTKKSHETSEASSSSEIFLSLNHPLPDEKGSPCVVDYYGESEDIKINDMVEIIGVVSIQPVLASFSEKKTEDPNDMLVGADNFMTKEEQAARYPPTSLVPTVHCVLFQPLKHSNPCIPQDINEKKVTSLISNFAQTREDLLTVLKDLLLGDAFAAEYLLLHLVSSVYTRCGMMAVGKFTLNLSGCVAPSLESSQGLPKQVAEVLKSLLPKCAYLPMSLDNLNNLAFVPKKDYTANRLMSGVLQISDNTELILDETTMESGKLQENGILNVNAVMNLISRQKLSYDFNFYQTDFQSNIQVLVLSEGKSMLPCDCQVKIQGSSITSENVLSSLSGQDLDVFRTYLGLVRYSEYSITPDMQKTLQDDFVQTRQVDPSSMTADDFHMYLLVARLIAMSYGQPSLTREIWDKVKNMESLRRARLPAQSN